jgi:hypothetical protein
MRRMMAGFGGLVILGATAAPAFAFQVALTPSKDNTLYEDAAGSLSNGAGQFLFVGRTGQVSNYLRRGLVAFDIAGAIPAGATIQNVQLTMTVSETIAGPQTLALHRVLADWGEGTSNSNVMGGGIGAAATAGDATWIHRFFSATNWTNAGGDFDATASATQSVDGEQAWTWGSTPDMVADVQGWLDDPAGNFGWLVRGNESESRTAKRFNSREHIDANTRPQLLVTYTAAPAAVPVLDPTTTAALAMLLLVAMAWKVRAVRFR